MMKVLKFFFTSLCILFLQACDDDGTASDNVNPTPRCEENDPNCYKLSIKDIIPYEGEYDFETYGNGEVVEFHWKETLAWFLESDKHEYGYDRDPYSNFDYEEAAFRGKDVYLSVETGKTAYVKIRIDKNSSEDFHLYQIKENGDVEKKDLVSAKDICKKTDCIDDIPLSSGNYVVFNGDEKLERYLHIIPYPKDSYKEVLFVKLGNENAVGCLNDKGETGCYTNGDVMTRFNTIMSQAVVNAKFTDVTPSEVNLRDGKKGFEDKLWIDLTEKRKKEIEIYDDEGKKVIGHKKIEYPIVNDLYEKIKYTNKYGCGKEYDELTEAAKLSDPVKDVYKEAYNNYITKVNEYNDALIRECTYEEGQYVNCSSKITTLKEELDELKKIRDDAETNYGPLIDDYNSKVKAFNNAYQDAREKHFALGINEMRIGWKVEGFTNEVYENFNAVINLCQKEEESGPIGIGDDDVICNKKASSLSMRLYNDCSKSSIPVQMKIGTNNKDEDSFFASISGAGSFDRKCMYFVYADVFPFVPDDAQTAQVTTCEYKSEANKAVIGGLVWGAHLNGGASLNTIVHEIGHSYGLTDLYIADDEPTFAATYTSMYNTFAFDEGNIMFWRIPSGQRIRYRPLFVVKTGTSERYSLNHNDLPPYATENQWECIRNSEKCFKDK